VIVVAAAGNSGSNAPNFPAAYAEFLPNVIAVGATQISQNSISMSEFSNHAGADKPYNFVDALGVDILGIGLNGQEGYWSGTSMAGPHVVGLVALLWSADPSRIGKIEETEALIKEKADPKTSSQTCGGVSGSARPNNTYGYGLGNAYEVVKSRLLKHP
jgi:subtilisin family serine protease